MNQAAPAFADTGDVLFEGRGSAKRLLLPSGVVCILRQPGDAAGVSVRADRGAGGARYVKDATAGPVRLLFPVDPERLRGSEPLDIRCEATAPELIEWATVVHEGDGGFDYERPNTRPTLEMRDGVRISRLGVKPAPPAPGMRGSYVCVQLAAEAGQFRFLRDAAGRVADGADIPAGSDVAVASVDRAARRAARRAAEREAERDALIAELAGRVADMAGQLRQVETLLARLRGGEVPATAAAPIAATPAVDPNAPLVNWVIGPKENEGWAYGNNARRLSGRLTKFRHAVAGDAPAEIALYFDPIVAERYPAEAHRSILRIGGPRPLDRLFSDDRDALEKGLERFSAVVPLNLDLHRRTRGVAGKLRFIPNALDLDEWHPEKRRHDTRKPFAVGFAASLNSSKEAEVKGFEIARRAAEAAGVELLMTQKKEGSTVPHDRMLVDFYSKCDVLLHPVAPGREGTSNVIMEALSVGLPVICTEASGFHGEFLTDRKNALVRERTVEAFAEGIALLRDDRKLRDRLGVAGRLFAERHHDLAVATRRYELLLGELLAEPGERKRRVCFVPFWEPAELFGSSRLRGVAAAAAIESVGLVQASVGYDPNADVVVVIQMCDDALLETLRRSDQFVVYDVCDRYFENPKLFKHPNGEVNTLSRYGELLDRADLAIVPTPELKVEVALRRRDRPVVHVPEPVDYGPESGEPADPARRTVLWFGNPGRGNFESARWMLDALRERHGYRVIIVSQPSYFRRHPEYQADVVEWSPAAMKEVLAEASLCVLSHADGEQTKSPNRMIAAVMHGVPTLVHRSTSCEDILRRANAAEAIVEGPDSFDAAVRSMEDPEVRRAYLARVQDLLGATHGPAAVAGAYHDALEAFHYPKAAGATKVGVVTHNLQLGEGAPRSLFELARGLNGLADVEAFVYSAGEGDLEELYRDADIPLAIFDRSVTHCVRSLNFRFGDLRAHFHEFLQRNHIEVLVCNTVKSAPFAYWAREMGIPSVVIVRESFEPSQRFSAITGEARLAAEVGLVEAEEVVFVAAESREAWRDFRFEGRIAIINNGVDPARFADALAMTKAQARAALGLPADNFVALCVGSISTRKGQALLAHAFAQLPAHVRDRSRVAFLGTAEARHLAPFNAALAAAAVVAGDRVTHMPAVEEIGPWYRAADVLMMNSSNEAYPRSVSEGQLFGLPVLSTRVFGVLTQVTDGVDGLLYDIGDLEEWKRLFATLVEDPALAERLGAAAGRSFWRHTTKAEMVGRYRALIGRLARRRREAAAWAG